MRRRTAIGILTGLVLAFAGTALAQEFGTGPEARAMLEKAVAALKADEAKALAAFSRTDGGFKDRDIYVFCFDTRDGKITAHQSSELMGKDIRALLANDGSPLGQKIFDAVKEGTTSSVTYNYPKPGSDVPAEKEAFLTKVGNQGCGVGYYK